jgi:hypothetical protein
MSSAGWSTTVRTGNPETDLQMVEQHRQNGAAQGLLVNVQPLPTGGYQITARPPGAVTGSPGLDVPPELGGTLPSAPAVPAVQPFDPNRQSAYAAMPVSAVPPSPYAGPMPGPVLKDAAAQFGGTLPSVAEQGYGAPGHGTRPRASGRAAPVGAVPRWTEGVGQCQACGRVGPTKSATFMQNIGVIIIRFPKTISGHLCKFCIDKYALQYTAITMLFGWWGVISFIYSLIAIPVNTIHWLRSIGMPTPPEDVQSLAEKKGRALWLMLLSVLLVLVLLFWMLVSVSMMIDPDYEDGVSAGLINLVIGVLLLGVPAALLAFFGVRGRLRASAGLRQMGAA